MLTAAQALQQLQEMANPTVEQLRVLVSQVDATQPAGSTTLLYSGNLAEVSGTPVEAWKVAVALNADNPNLAIINNTEVGVFLDSDLLKNTLRNAVGG